jgi:hypothetical protein
LCEVGWDLKRGRLASALVIDFAFF